MSIVSIPYTFSAGAVIVAAQHNSNFSVIYNDYNGNIDNTNIAVSAAIGYGKLNLTGSILNADLAGSIADSKLSQITTASKVSGTAITGLASLPSGAGVIPSANLPSPTVDTNTSNVLFQYSAVTSNGITLATGSGKVLGSSNVPTTGGTWDFLEMRQSSQGAYSSVWQTKWIKFSGVSTVTIWAEIWQNGTNTCGLKVDIGGQNNTVTGTASQTTPEWKSLTIDVSSLSNGTAYTVVASLAWTTSGGTVSSYLGNLIAFGS